MAFAVPVPRGSSHSSHTTNWGNASFSGQTAADEATIDGYAMKVLEDASPPDLSVDADYLGPYLTSVLRAEEVTTVEDLEDYDNLLELLQEHCSMARQDAKLTLQKIAQAVITGTIPTFPGSSPTLGPFGSPPTSGAHGLSALQLLETVNVEEAAALQVDTSSKVEETQEEAKPSSDDVGQSLISPVQPDNLIPVDLWGAIDAEETPTAAGAATANLMQAPIAPSDPLEEEFPSLAVAAKTISKKASRSSRSRQGSIDESSLLSDHSSNNSSNKKVSPQPTPVTQQQQPQPYYYTMDDAADDTAAMLQMACDTLIHMNPDMGQDAIFHAVTMADSNVGVAQYLMDCAMTAPPVCRHLLHSGCYRSDCQFNHDLEGHSCVFWLRGHCNKGQQCQFLHGYNEQWLIQLEQQQAEYYSNNSSHYPDGSWEQQQQQQQPATTTTQPLNTSTNSFANIASQGYNDQTCFQSTSDSEHFYVEETKLASSAPSMKIPQDVWNPHERRDASAFHIADPMERYREVSRHSARTDVVDLHFQSTKTFAQVLHQVLPEKLEEAGVVGLWIVTGTGHHVGSKTHQKGGGILESCVHNWLAAEGYEFWKGKDRNGHGGAVYVKKQQQSGSIQQ